MTHKSAGLAALLSFLFPGLGHEYLGRRRAALVFALPAVIALVAIGLEALTGLDSVLAFVITPSGAMTILALVVLTGLWRLIAMVDAVLVVRRRSGLRRPAVAATGILLAVVLATHGAMAYMAYSVYDASARIFVDSGPDGTAVASPAPSGLPGGIGRSCGPVPGDAAGHARDGPFADQHPADRHRLCAGAQSCPHGHAAGREREPRRQVGGHAEPAARHLELPALRRTHVHAARSTP